MRKKQKKKSFFLNVSSSSPLNLNKSHNNQLSEIRNLGKNRKNEANKFFTKFSTACGQEEKS